MRARAWMISAAAGAVAQVTYRAACIREWATDISPPYCDTRLAVDMDIHGYIHGYCAVAFAN